MVDHTLHGNCAPCPACGLRRENVSGQVNDCGPITDHRHVRIECNICNNHGLMPLSAQEIVEKAAAEARLNYWPEREAAWARQMGNVVDLSSAKKKRAGQK